MDSFSHIKKWKHYYDGKVRSLYEYALHDLKLEQLDEGRRQELSVSLFQRDKCSLRIPSEDAVEARRQGIRDHSSLMIW